MSTTHSSIKDGWFKETGELWPGQAMCLRVDEILHHEKSLFQDVLVFRSTNYGNVLVLDGAIQCTERDEFSYQEMISHIPLGAHSNPRRVLVIGGGDGGVLREIAKDPRVEEITLCEIDEAVIRVSKTHLPEMAKGFDDPKVKMHIGDGFAFMAKNKNTFDVIVTDSSDPIGPAESLFQEEYYKLMRDALRDNGILCCQGECQWLNIHLIRSVLDFARELFPTVQYAYTTIPTYPSGQIGFILCSKESGKDLSVPVKQYSKDEADKQFRYYNSDVHSAAFVLPQFAKKALFE